ncbi:hypothetical protein C0389_02505 [bacterium]|nr:hypothetical protein [bacterium]
MLAKIHKEMAFQIISDYPKQSVKEFLLNGIAKPEWKKDNATKIKWLKEWMDMPDNSHHSSKLKNDHSYKITKDGKRFKIVFAKSGFDQATVISRLKYSARDIAEWKVEEEYRVCALELSKSIHWVIDLSSPPHTLFGWESEQNNGTSYHSKIENDFDKVWPKYYDKNKIKWGKKNPFDDIYKWAKNFVEDRYERNMKLLELYRSKKTMIKNKDAENLGREVILDLAQNLADYLSYIDKKIDFDKMVTLLPK